MSDSIQFLFVLVVAPAVALFGATFVPGVRRGLRPVVLAAATASAVAALALLVAGLWIEGAGSFERVLLQGPADEALVRVDSLTLPLFPMAALTWLCGLVIAPARSFAADSARRSSLAFLAMALAFATASPQFLAFLIAVASLVFLLEHRRVERVRRVAGVYLSASLLLFVAGASLLAAGDGLESAGLWLIVAGLLVRKGIVPLHSWMPDVFERGHLVPALLFNAPQVGTYAAAVIVLPSAPEGALTLIAVASLITTLYGALLAAVEPDTRRAFGYLFMSQSALVLVGLGSGLENGVAGSLAVWVAAGLSMTGLGLTIAALELRRGRLSLRDHHGGYEQMPLLAASFLVFGLASVGFPGTLGFLGEELLIAGSVERFTFVGFVVVAATALNGVTVLKMYFSLFCGKPDGHPALALRGRETAVFAVLAALLVAGGLFPKNLVDSRVDAAEAILGAAAAETGGRGG